MSDLDNIDIQILKLLQNNSNLTTKDLANKVNLSTTPVFERIKRLEKNGYIKKYVAVLDAEKLDKGLTVFCNITLKQHTREIGNKFVKDIVAIKEVTECYNVSGDYDFLLKVMVKDMKHYQDFVLNHLGSIKNIGSAHSTFVMGDIKNTYSVPI
ncbi:Lrp/AsnC family transcriptional regulator [Arenibacter palladensis]|jgi:Lrp/AsnC family leucine-responsive transcriptional regulator|uniref:Lrp/AsnC family transcriptional regulator n=1 Tax=Arenibacter palladensis TaxID=237373 RepID=UPI0026E2F76B|nr:Lrp/AsnC family transcriptional regulator [Arenibacter palladensis]MDO6602218.1 Lrp/AsnC family transcriptional regulator [Arenibacter palladensis]|tara:strand:+ start:21803 stop:22264 length:462 start_codon:yes stop_codon:yes gene_type:complete